MIFFTFTYQQSLITQNPNQMNKILLVLITGLITCNAFAQDTITNQLKTAYKAKQYDLIIAEHKEQVKAYPAKAIYYVGMAYYHKSLDNECLKLMNLAITKDNTDPKVFFTKGMALNYLGRFDEAIQSFNNAIELDSTNSNTYAALGDAYFHKEALDQALIAYQTAIQKDEPADQPFVMIPQIYAAQNNIEKVLESCYNAKAHIDKSSDSYQTVLYNIGLYSLLSSNYDQAEPALIELLSLSPDDYQAHAKLIQVHYGKKEYEKAEPYRQKLYAAYDQGILEGSLKEMFCFDQFNWKDKLVQVFERFEDREGELYYKHLFYILNNKTNKIECTIQTENSPGSIELGGPKYAIGMDKNNSHSTFAFIEADFKYADLKAIVIQILEEEMKPVASSFYYGNQEEEAKKESKEKRKKKRKRN